MYAFWIMTESEIHAIYIKLMIAIQLYLILHVHCIVTVGLPEY